jgi:hypothetical protein
MRTLIVSGLVLAGGDHQNRAAEPSRALRGGSVLHSAFRR